MHVPIWDIVNLHGHGSTLELLKLNLLQKLHALIPDPFPSQHQGRIHLSLPIYTYSCLLFTRLQQDDAYSDLLCNLKTNVKHTAFKKKKNLCVGNKI